MIINKEEVTNKFQTEIESKLLNNTFDKTENYTIKISNVIAEVFIVNILGIYEGRVDGFDVKPIEMNNNILFKIQTTNEVPIADVLLSISIKENELTITNVLTTIKLL